MEMKKSMQVDLNGRKALSASASLDTSKASTNIKKAFGDSHMMVMHHYRNFVLGHGRQKSRPSASEPLIDHSSWHSSVAKSAHSASVHIVSALRFMDSKPGLLTPKGSAAAKGSKAGVAAISSDMVTPRGKKVLELGYRDYLKDQKGYGGVPQVKSLEKAYKKASKVSESSLALSESSMSFADEAFDVPEADPIEESSDTTRRGGNVYLRETPLS
jgi:hypothetical protein